MPQKFVQQKEFDDFVLTITQTVATKEDLFQAKEELSANITALEKKMLRSFDAVWERFHLVDQRFDSVENRLEKLEKTAAQILERLPK